MHVLKRYMALLAMAESSEVGRLIARRVILDAVVRAQADANEPLDDESAEELLRALSSETSIDNSPWMEAFEYYLAKSPLPGQERILSSN